MLTEINGNIDATYPIIIGELTGYLGPIGTVTASADNSVGTPHVIVTQTPTPDGLDIDFAFKEMGIPGLDLTVEQDLTEEQQQTARENIDAQETLTFDAAPTQGSQNPVTSEGIYAADEDLKDYVDDSINRSSAFFRGNFATYAALMAVPWQTTDPDAPNFVSNNDYAAVADDETHSHESWRYIYVLEEGGQDNGWTAQYRINESPFTVEQLAAINSGITANDVTKLAGIEQGAQVNTVTGVKGDAEANYRTGNINITKANIGLGNIDNTSDANKPVSTAQQAAIEAATKALYDVKSAGPAAIVSIHDAEAIPVKSLVAQITPVQSGSGDPAPDNIRPISGWTGANISVYGANLYNPSKSTENVRLKTDGDTSAQSGYYTSEYIKVAEGNTYARTSQFTANRLCCVYDANKNFIRYVDSGYTVTIASGEVWVRIAGNNNAQIFALNGITAGTFVGSTINVDWTDEAGTVYGGTLNVTTGELTVIPLALTMANKTSLTVGTSGAGVKYADIGTPVTLENNIYLSAISSAYKAIPQAQTAVSGEFKVYSNAITVFDNRFTDVATATSILTSENFIAVAKRLSPLVCQLTPTEVKTLLGDNNIFCDTGDVQVTYETGTVAVALADLYEKLAAQIGA